MGKVRFPRLLWAAFGLCAACAPKGSARPPQPDNPFDFVTTEGRLRITLLSPNTVRCSLTRSPAGTVPASFALDSTGNAPPSFPFQTEQSDDAVVIRTSELGLRIEKHPLRVQLLDAAGRVLGEQASPVAWQERGFVASFRLGEGERVFGLGDKARGFDRRGSHFELWNTDAYGFEPTGDPLYKSIPFFVFADGRRAHGLFIDTPARAEVDVGKADPSLLSFAAARGDAVDFYLFAGPDPKRVVSAYGALTGRMPLPPRWALGYHQSRYSYLTEQETRAVAQRLRNDAIPSDALWLDIDYQQDNAPFTVNRQAFPTFPGMVADLERAHFRTVVITDPHPKSYQGKPQPSGYTPYDSGAAGDHFLRSAQGGFFEDKVWPGASVFPEFTLSRTRRWWGELYRDFVAQGVAGFWNDMNEPATFDPSHTLPEFVRHRFDDGSSLDHAAIHNAWGGLNARATYEGVRRLRPNERPFVLTRAAYAGTQRYAATWTGDNSATREHLALSIAQLANLGVSGYAFSGVDLGGFVGCPDPELLVEWTEVAAFQPFFRNHSAKDACRREPWVHGPAIEARIRTAIERRYRLLPYLYTVFEEASRTGLPILRPLWLEYPSDSAVGNDASAFLLGADLLVAPKLVEGNAGFDVQLPNAPFYDTETGELHAAGGKVHVASGSLRVYARAGAIIPQQPLVQSTDEVPSGPLRIEVWPGHDCRGSLYLDDGHSFAYRTGAFRRIDYRCEVSEQAIHVSAKSTGNYAPWWKSVELVIHGHPRAPGRSTTLRVAEASADWDARLDL